MIHKAQNFVESFVGGKAAADDIYDFIEQWHESDCGMDLPTYLGLTAEEYASWLENPKSLQTALTIRQAKATAKK